MKPAALALLLGLQLAALQAWAGGVDVIVTSADGKPVRDAVVYAENAASAKAPLTAVGYAIEQKGKQFLPSVNVVQAGTAVQFPNNDSVRHHVYSFSPTKTFELKLYSGVPAAPVVFDKPGTVVLGCNIHDNMAAWVHVVDTPYFAKTDETGKARLSLPSGSYMLKTWHARLATENKADERSIAVKDALDVAVQLALKP